MADLLPNIELPRKTMVDLYAESGISVGVQIRVVNNGNSRVRLYAQADEPDPNSDGFVYLSANNDSNPSVAAENDEDDTGAWAYSEASDGLVNVVEV